MKRSYTVEVRTAPLEQLDDTIVDRFSRELFRDRRIAGPVAGANLVTRVLSVRGSADAVGLEDAVAKTLPRVLVALRRAGLGEPDLTEAAVHVDLPEDEFASSRDDLVGTPEVAARLGLTRERIRQLAAARGRFPPPIGNIRETKVWRWGDIADWIAAGGRRPAGRPRTIAATRRSPRKPARKARTTAA
jgi:predicted DNA-binding transcriptional regulator AlpA